MALLLCVIPVAAAASAEDDAALSRIVGWALIVGVIYLLLP
jgi:hypothetical protein